MSRKNIANERKETPNNFTTAVNNWTLTEIH